MVMVSASSNGAAMVPTTYLRPATDMDLIEHIHPDPTHLEAAGGAGTLMPHVIAHLHHRWPMAGLG
jgi:hypothetical protein